MKKGMAPQIRVSDMEMLSEWDFANVKAFGDSIPGYRSSASRFFPSICVCPLTVVNPLRSLSMTEQSHNVRCTNDADPFDQPS
jgi:hypothetical protein